MPSSPPPTSPLMQALRSNSLTAQVIDCDHYRVPGLYLAVETDYIIEIQATDASFTTYRISKHFSAFRSLRKDLKAIAKHHSSSNKTSPLGQYCLFMAQSIGAEPTSYLGKTSYHSVKSQTKQRRRILDMVLTATCAAPFQQQPAISDNDASTLLVEPILKALERFLLTDVVSEDEQSLSSRSDNSCSKLTVDTSSPANKATGVDAVVPISKRRRLCMTARQQEHQQLKEACSRQEKVMTSAATMMLHPMTFLPWFIAAVAVFYEARKHTVELSVDVVLLLVAAACLVGRHSVMFGQTVVSKKSTNGLEDYDTTMVNPNPSELLRRSLSVRSKLSTPTMAAQPCSPLPEFPEGAELGSHTNCWSRPAAQEFVVRGPNYDKDHKKVPSVQFLCPVSGLDLFLTDACPETVYQNSALLGGTLHDKPRIVINFRLPWGVMLLYGDIPERFVPYLHDKELSVDQFEDKADRALAKWLQEDSQYRNERLKIIPSVVDGPWVVRGVVSGRPALLGAKLPVEYHFGNDILEISLDICASAAARGILSVARTYTQVLTLNLGFCIEDINSEQMLIGVRLHGLNPLEAPEYIDA